VGQCHLDASIQNTEELLKLADACAYISKNSGRNALCVYPDKTIYHRD
jgi:GGDEF domain-containing protein